MPQDGEEHEMPGFDVRVPSSARVWNYWVGGKDNFAADREAGEQILQAMPTLRAIAHMSRRFLVDVVDDLAAERGITQFLDIGTGLPTADNTHDVAQRAVPSARIVYADHDPVVLTHARALLTSTPEGKTDYIQADVRDPEVILSAAQRTLDFSQPVAVILIFVMHFVTDAEDPYDVVRRLLEPLPSGSYLVMGHAASDIAADFMAAGADAYNDRVSAQITPRDHAGVSRFFDGLELIDPGVAPMAQWLGASGDRGLQAYGGVGRKL
ncbi:MAG TPA: SAM-dependent methyltransferase [Streptosporangiaceae bacterium]|nr:SAM-dependent methyltransferase [Streptosporangiaceae bacterium]